jgi:bacterioferritin-associated ferredoxin
MWVCLCRGVTSGTISRVVSEGATTVKAVTSACGAGSDCTKCAPTILRLVNAARSLAPTDQLQEHRR